jgi:hypothetical protein
MAEMPKALVRGDEALHIAPSSDIRRLGSPRQHHLQHAQKLLGNLQIRLIAGVVEGDQDLV